MEQIPPPTSASDELKTPFINLFLIALTALILFSFAVAPVSAEDVNQIYVDIDSANALAKALNESAVDTASQGENAYVGDDDKTVIMKNSVNLTKILKFINSDEIKLITEEGTTVHINCSASTPTLISLDKMILIDNGKLNLTSNETNAGHLIFDGYNTYLQSTRIIAIGQNGCLNMSDGVTLKNCTYDCVSNKGTFNMFGGNITGNGDLNDIYVMGYGIYNYYSGTINMYGGNITGNDEGVNNHGTFNMSAETSQITVIQVFIFMRVRSICPVEIS
ncbi:MAG: hypothetical protein Q4Q53_04150 [Methanocorpusculum sp.]|nr:hypothetical protein [Methanocorpusculum sp.]